MEKNNDQMKKVNDRNRFRGCPVRRPVIRIEPVPDDDRIREIDCRELRWWGIIPLPGERAVMAIYDPPDWRLTSVTELAVTGAGSVHGVDGAVITQAEWEHADATSGGVWRMERMRVMGRLTDDCAQWLAMLTDYEGDGDGMAVTTFLDETFQAGFPDLPRRIVDAGEWSENEPGILEVPGLSADRQVCRGVGTFDVTVGERTERCIRVFECTLSERSMLIEAYLNREGRSVLVRRYNGFQWQVTGDRDPWNVRLQGQPVLKINGVSFIHWYDCVFLSH